MCARLRVARASIFLCVWLRRLLRLLRLRLRLLPLWRLSRSLRRPHPLRLLRLRPLQGCVVVVPLVRFRRLSPWLLHLPLPFLLPPPG